VSASSGFAPELIEPPDPSRVVPFGERMWTVPGAVAMVGMCLVALGVAQGSGVFDVGELGVVHYGSFAAALVLAGLARYLWTRPDLTPRLADIRTVPPRTAVLPASAARARRGTLELLKERVLFLAGVLLMMRFAGLGEDGSGVLLAVAMVLILGGVMGQLALRATVSAHGRRRSVRVYEADPDSRWLDDESSAVEEFDDGVERELGPDLLYGVSAGPR